MPSFEDHNAWTRYHVAVPVVLCEDTQCEANYRYQIFVSFHDNMSYTSVRLFWNDTSLSILPVVWIWQLKYPYNGTFLPFFCAISYQHLQKSWLWKRGTQQQLNQATFSAKADSVENTGVFFKNTNAVQSDTECGVRTQNVVCPPSVRPIFYTNIGVVQRRYEAQ